MKVVMTGAAGGVGTMTRRHLVGVFDQLIVSDRREITQLHDGETFVQADLTDLAAMERLLEGADGIIHLGGQPVEADWEAVHSANIVGLYNTYEAARRQGCSASCSPRPTTWSATTGASRRSTIPPCRAPTCATA